MWMMILIGTALAAGFIFALRLQINTYKLGQAEEELKATLDEYTGQQRYLMLDQQRALSAGESDRAGKQAGLSQLRLDQQDARYSHPVQKASLTTMQKVTVQKASVAAQRKAPSPKASASTARKGAAQKSPPAMAQKGQVQRKTTPADRRNQLAKAKREGDNRRQATPRSRQRR